MTGWAGPGAAVANAYPRDNARTFWEGSRDLEKVPSAID